MNFLEISPNFELYVSSLLHCPFTCFQVFPRLLVHLRLPVAQLDLWWPAVVDDEVLGELRSADAHRASQLLLRDELLAVERPLAGLAAVPARRRLAVGGPEGSEREPHVLGPWPGVVEVRAVPVE